VNCKLKKPLRENLFQNDETKNLVVFVAAQEFVALDCGDDTN